MRNFCIFLLSWLSFCSVSQADEPGWYTGEVMLNSEFLLAGEIRYNWRADVVQYRKDGRVQAFSPHKLHSFSFFDEQLNTIRRFRSLRFAKNGNYRTKLFFEVILMGSLQLVRRSNQLAGINLPTSMMLAEDEDVFYQLSGYTYYVHVQNRFVNIKHFRRKLWPLMTQEFGAELKKFMKEYQISLHTISGKLRLINQYNVLKKQRSQLFSKALPVFNVRFFSIH